VLVRFRAQCDAEGSDSVDAMRGRAPSRGEVIESRDLVTERVGVLTDDACGRIVDAVVALIRGE
jgi:hypothetical protein